MEVYTPAYYHRFHCIASACPDSCCQEWDVFVDEETAKRYRTLPGQLGDRLRSHLRREDGDTVIALEDGRCPMWRRDGLCALQAEFGHEALCQVCREFPRLRHDYGSFLELGLELSCPEAARLILSQTDSQLLRTTVPGGEEPEYDEAVMEILLRTRRELLAFVDSRAADLPRTLSTLLLYAHSVQEELDGGEEAALRLCTPAQSEQPIPLQPFFRTLEILTPRWRQMLTLPPSPPHWQPAHRSLLRYLIQRYWLQAVSDFDIVCRAKLILSATLLVASLPGDPVTTAQLFSKEIENDPDNIDTILDAAYDTPSLTDRNLLNLILF